MAPNNNENNATAIEQAGEVSWQIKCQGLAQRLAEVLNRGLWPDCTLEVGCDAEKIPAHRMLLASASPVFAAMFFGPLAPPERSDHLFSVPDVDPDTFKLLLQYIYSDDITVESCDNACKLYKAARYFILPHLEEVCKSHLVNNMSAQNVLQVYEMAQTYEDEEITKTCLEIMGAETENVLKQSQFKEAKPGTLAELFSLDMLAIDSELELFDATMRWVLAWQDRALSTQENDSKTKDENIEAAKKQIRPAIEKIRFLCLSGDQFANHDMTGLLSQSEILAISLNLHSPTTYVPMPDGFAVSKIQRTQNTIKFVIKDIVNLTKDSKECRESDVHNVLNLTNELAFYVQIRHSPMNTDLLELYLWFLADTDVIGCNTTFLFRFKVKLCSHRYFMSKAGLEWSTNNIDVQFKSETEQENHQILFLPIKDLLDSSYGYIHWEHENGIVLEVKINIQTNESTTASSIKSCA